MTFFLFILSNILSSMMNMKYDEVSNEINIQEIKKKKNREFYLKNIVYDSMSV